MEAFRDEDREDLKLLKRAKGQFSRRKIAFSNPKIENDRDGRPVLTFNMKGSETRLSLTPEDLRSDINETIAKLLRQLPP